ncbi:MAG TPA: metallophosphoesterase [Terriglobia bacterium]|nr:metallophosphoesterase [Terriglobia bacterium]
MNRRTFLATLGSAATFRKFAGKGQAVFNQRGRPRFTVTTTRQPYVQNVRNDGASIMWATAEPGMGIVEYSPDGIDFQRVSAKQEFFSADQTASSTDFYQYTATISGLQPSTDYQYRAYVDRGAVWAGGGSTFRTAGPGPFNFVALGDSGYASPEQSAIAQRILAEKPAFVIHTGDVVYNPGGAPGTSIDLYQRNYFDYYSAIMSCAPFFPCPGNHDFGPDLTPYFAVHSFPDLTVPSADYGQYYSFDWGNAHFVSLDAHKALVDAVNSGGQMLQWLDNDLRATRQFWRIVYFHYPPFAAGPNMTEPREALVRQYVIPILEKYGVQVVLSGHEHSYQRSQPIRNSTFVTPHTGTNYLTCGGGGAFLYPVLDGYPYVAFGQSAYHYVRAQVQGTQLTLHAIRHDGVEIDTYTIAPVPFLSDDPAVQPVSVSSGLAAGATISINGYNLAEREVISDSSGPQPSLGGTAVTVNGVNIPLLFVGPNEIRGVLPSRVDGNATVGIKTANGFIESSI